MKANLHRFLKYCTTLLVLLLLVTNCENEDTSVLDESQLEQTTPPILNQKIPFEQAQHFNQLQGEIKKINGKLKETNYSNKEDSEDIQILTDEVLYITYANTHTYSFKVVREHPQAFIENIVLHYNLETEMYDEYLVQYHISTEEFVNIYNGEFLNSSMDVTIIDLESGFFEGQMQSRGCTRSCRTVFVNCSSGEHHSENVSEWGNCTADTPPRAYQSCTVNCPANEEITTPSGPSGGGGGGGANTVVTDPLPVEPCETTENEGVGISDGDGGCLIFENDCNTSSEALRELFPNSDIYRLEEIANAINTHGQDFGIDTKEKLQHFLAQAGHESNNMNNFEENLNYRVNKLGIDYWRRYFNPYTDPEADPNKANPNDYASSTSDVYVDHEAFANCVYNDEFRKASNKLGNTIEGDGFRFRGRGLFQLTGRDNYTEFSNFFQLNYNQNIDLTQTPGLLSSNMEIAVISALWYYKKKVIDKINIDSSTSVLKVTLKINGGKIGLPERKELFEDCEEHIDCVE